MGFSKAKDMGSYLKDYKTIGIAIFSQLNLIILSIMAKDLAIGTH